MGQLGGRRGLGLPRRAPPVPKSLPAPHAPLAHQDEHRQVPQPAQEALGLPPVPVPFVSPSRVVPCAQVLAEDGPGCTGCFLVILSAFTVAMLLVAAVVKCSAG